MSFLVKIGKVVKLDDLSEKERLMLQLAKATMEKAWNPYSGFFVGAAVLTQKGDIIGGANYEVAAYGASICAERAALLRANSMGQGAECVAIAVVTRKGNEPTREVSASCGSCRQMIYEAAQRSGVEATFKVIFATTNFDKIVVTTIGELLPLAFGPKDLKVKV